MNRPLRTESTPALLADQVEILYSNMPTAVLANAVGAGILAAAEWPIVTHRSLLVWVLAMWIVAGARALLVWSSSSA